jgi:tRNA nucleotidyltransferase (CCA-adding enzyme)
MGIPESQLEIWSRQGSAVQSRDTYATIKGALEEAAAPYAGKTFGTFLQGSYGNDTNIYADSDVDVVIRLDSTFFYDEANLSEDQKNAFHRAHPNASYGLGNSNRM